MSLKNITVICGPTGSGKTALALRLAQEKPTSIISADSRQIYRGLDILTGKDIPPNFKKEKDYYTNGRTRLFGFDLIDPDQTMSAGQFSAYARAILAKETQSGRRVIIVGGTGFYLQAVTDPASLSRVIPQAELRRELNALSLEQLQQRLWEIDPHKFMALNDSDIKNPRRLIRALEIVSAPPLSTASVSDPVAPLSFSWIGLSLPLEQIQDRITRRVEARLDRSVTEVEALQKDYPDQTLPVYTAIGVKQIVRFLAGSLSREQLLQLWITEEAQYAKRQLTWFKKSLQIIWYDQDRVSSLSLQ